MSGVSAAVTRPRSPQCEEETTAAAVENGQVEPGEIRPPTGGLEDGADPALLPAPGERWGQRHGRGCRPRGPTGWGAAAGDERPAVAHVLTAPDDLDAHLRQSREVHRRRVPREPRRG